MNKYLYCGVIFVTTLLLNIQPLVGGVIEVCKLSEIDASHSSSVCIGHTRYNTDNLSADEFQTALSMELWNRTKVPFDARTIPQYNELGGEKVPFWNWQFYHSMWHALTHFGDRKTRTNSGTGLWLDFGVYQGWSVNMSRTLLPNDIEVHGFDTFTGLPEPWAALKYRKGKFDLDGILPPVKEGIVLHKGLFNETLPQFMEKHADKWIYGISVDCDLYRGAMDILTMVGPHLQKGSIVHFHELNNKERGDEPMEEAVALYDWLKEQPSSLKLKLVPMRNSIVPNPAVFIVSRKKQK